MIEESSSSIKLEPFIIKLAGIVSLDGLNQFCGHIEEQKKELWLRLHPSSVTKQKVKQFGRARRWLDGLLRLSYRNLNKLPVQAPASVRVQDQAESLAKLQKLYTQFSSRAHPHVLEYDPDILELARKENIGSVHYDKGFEPCYDWGGLTRKPIPSWAQVYLGRKQSLKSPGEIPKKKLPSEVTDQGIEYCTYYYKENKPIVRAYRRIGYKPSKYFCQYCLYKLSDAQIVNRSLTCPKCGNILFPPERINALIENRMKKLSSDATTQAHLQENQYKSKRQQWLDQQWQGYEELFQDNPLLEKKVREFIKADYVMNPGQYSRSLFRASTLPQFSLKLALFRMIAIRKRLFAYLSDQELKLDERRIRKGQAQKLDPKELLFSDIREQFVSSSFTVPRLIYFLLLCSEASLTLSSDRKTTLENNLYMSLDINAFYQTLFDVMFLRFKKPFKLQTGFQFSKDGYLRFSIEDSLPATDSEVDASKRRSSREMFLESVHQFFLSFKSDLFLLRKEESFHECKLDFQVAFQALWDQFQSIPPSRAPRVARSREPADSSKRSRTRLKRAILIGSIIGMIVIGFMLGGFWFNSIYTVGHDDSVKIDYVVWTSDESKSHDPLNPVLDTIVLVHVIPITEDGENGLILGLYNALFGKNVGFDSGLVWLNKCIDQDRNGIDDVTGQPALTYGNSSDLYFNTCLMLQFRIIDIVKPQAMVQFGPVVFAWIFSMIALIWLAGYVAMYLVKKKPKITKDEQILQTKEFYSYDDVTRHQMIEKNKGTRHDKEGFEPVNDWGGSSDHPIPGWANRLIQEKMAGRKKDGRIPRHELASELKAQQVEYCTFFFEEAELILRAYRARDIVLKKQTQMSALIHGIHRGIGSLDLGYFLVLPLVVLIGMLEFYLVFILSDFQYLDVLVTEYPFLFLFHIILIASSALLISWGLIRFGFFAARHFNHSKLRRVRLILLILIDIMTIWSTFTLFTIILDPLTTGNVLRYLPIFITFWSVVWGLVYVRLRVKK